MYISRFLLPLFLFAFIFPAKGFIIDKILYGGVEFVGNTGAEARSDLTVNSSTVRATLGVNFAVGRWELHLSNYQTGSEDLTSGLDVTAGTELEVELFTYPVGDPQYGRGYYIHGQDLSEFDYDPVLNKVKFKFKPMVPVLSASYSGGYTAAAGVDIYYRGTYQPPSEIMYGPPVVTGDILCVDVGRAMHPSSGGFRGKVLNFNGVNGQQGNFRYYLGSRHAAAKGYDLINAQAFVDGTQPAAGFGYSSSAVAFPMNLGDASEDFRVTAVFNLIWSAHDIQVGQFPVRLQFTDIYKEAGGIRLFWNAESNKTCTLEYFLELGGATNVLGTNLLGPDFLDAGANAGARFYRLIAE